MEASDLAEYEAEVTSPLHIRYRGYDVYGVGLPTQSPVMLEALKILEDGVAALRVDADCRLVEQQDVGIVQQAGGEIQSPLHAAAERLDAIGGAIGETDQRQRRDDGLVQRL